MMTSYIVLLSMFMSSSPHRLEQTCAIPVHEETEQTLFTFNHLLIAASSVANRSELISLGRHLLADKPNPMMDSRYPIRRILRQQTEHLSVATRKKMLHFLLQHPTAVTNYNALVTQLFAPAPLFTPRSQGAFGGPQEQLIYQDREQLSELLQLMHQEGSGQFWKHLRHLWAQHQFCPDYIISIHQELQSYTKTAWALPTGTRIVVNPLMPAESGVTSIYADGHFLTIVGPSQNSRGQAILLAHELAHPLIHLIWDHHASLRQQLQASTCIYQQLMQESRTHQLSDAVYNNWSSYFSEGLVRAISHRMMGTYDKESTILLADTIDQQLQQYEQSNLDLAQYVTPMLQTMQQRFCKTTWAQFRPHSH